jgi:hypothetical protein
MDPFTLGKDAGIFALKHRKEVQSNLKILYKWFRRRIKGPRAIVSLLARKWLPSDTVAFLPKGTPAWKPIPRKFVTSC